MKQFVNKLFSEPPAWFIIMMLALCAVLLTLGSCIGGPCWEAWADAPPAYKTGAVNMDKNTSLDVTKSGDQYVFTIGAQNSVSFALRCSNTDAVFYQSYRMQTGSSGRNHIATTATAADIWFNANPQFGFSGMQANIIRVENEPIRGKIYGFVSNEQTSVRSASLWSGTSSTGQTTTQVAAGTTQYFEISHSDKRTTMGYGNRAQPNGYNAFSFFPQFLQPIQSFILLQAISQPTTNPIIVINNETRRGDILLVHTDLGTSANRDTDFAQIGSVSEVIGSMYAYVQDNPSDQIIWSHSGQESQGIVMRPLYDLDGQIPSLNYRQMLIPSYMFGNSVDKKVSCYAIIQPFKADPERTYQTQAVTFTPDAACPDAPNMPDVLLLNDYFLSWNDIRPDVCREGTETDTDDDGIEPVDKRIEVEIPTATEVDRYDYRDVFDVQLMQMPTGTTVQLLTKERDHVYGTAVGNLQRQYGIASCSLKGDISGRTATIPMSEISDRDLGGTKAQYATHNGAVQTFSNSESVHVSCKNVLLRNNSQIERAYTFDYRFVAPEPKYQEMIKFINNNGFGWGTGGNLGIMGLPFVAVMGIMSAFAGYNRSHIPAAIIVYVSILGIMTVTDIIQLSDAVFGAIIMLAALGIFAKGLNRGT